MISSTDKLKTPPHRHWKLKELAQKLRSQGRSYKEILERVPVSKSTVSLWCRYVPLTSRQRARLWAKRRQQLHGIQAIQRMFWKRRCEVFDSGTALVPRINKDSRFVAGLVLYWAEGTKRKDTAISNSDPRIIKFMVQWLKEFFSISPQSLVIHLHLHSGQNETIIKRYWSKLTGIPLSNFHKSFIKPEGSGYRKNILYNGTVKLRVRGQGSTYLLFRILGGIAGFLKRTIDETPKIKDWILPLPYAEERAVSSIGRAGRS